MYDCAMKAQGGSSLLRVDRGLRTPSPVTHLLASSLVWVLTIVRFTAWTKNILNLCYIEKNHNSLV
jgi:hypothetical protein